MAGLTVYLEGPEKVTLPPPRSPHTPAERAQPPLTPEELAGVFWDARPALPRVSPQTTSL